MLREAITSVVRERAAVPPTDIDRSLDIVMRFLAQAERISLQGFRHAATVES
jgi:hypothetical protein